VAPPLGPPAHTSSKEPRAQYMSRICSNYSRNLIFSANGVSELGLAPHRATVLTTRRAPADFFFTASSPQHAARGSLNLPPPRQARSVRDQRKPGAPHALGGLPCIYPTTPLRERFAHGEGNGHT
jgi:hypothetical protein